MVVQALEPYRGRRHSGPPLTSPSLARPAAAAIAGLLCLAWAIRPLPALAGTYVYVSNADDGNISSYAMNESDGALSLLARTDAAKLVMPMAVSPDHRHLYAVVRSKPYGILTYAIDGANGGLTLEASAALPDSMAYIWSDASGKFLLTASYGGDKIAVSPVARSGLAEADAREVIPTGKTAHCIITDRTNRFVFVSNLGSDQILQYRFNAKSGALTPNNPPLTISPAGNGPRHMIVSPDNKSLYVVHELSGLVIQYAISRSGTLRELTRADAVPADSGMVPGSARAAAGAADMPSQEAPKPKIWAADIHMTPNGRFLYVSERTSSKIALLSLDPANGAPHYVTSIDTETQPRGFAVDPTGRYLVGSGEKSDQISVYAIDQNDGHLNRLGRYPAGHDANWVEIVSTK